jgi:hypothetical protein
MGTLTIYFVGICSHLWQENPESRDPHRAILVNAQAGVPDRGIEPHFPSMRADPTDIIAGEIPELTGVTLTIRDRVATIDYGPSYRGCIPHLESYTDELVEIDHEVTRGRNPARTAAYVDVHGGRWRAGVDKGGAAVAYVTIQTDTTDVALSIEKFNGERLPDLVLKDNAAIQVENTGRALDDNDHDFLLHFLITGSIPGDAWWPDKDDLKCERITLPWGAAGTVGPGCSNSNYP